jgi:glutamine synthetase
MPKPLYGITDRHAARVFLKDGVNRSGSDGYGGLSKMALYYIGGIIKHSMPLRICNPDNKSYKRCSALKHP